MKYFQIMIFSVLCIFSTPAVSQTAPSGTISYQQFYEQLSPYGTWINYPGYGEVWHPNVGSDFKPYATNGYWENTDRGWYWESGYEWGWAPFHYGNWFYDTNYGWLWEPGYEWSPAWVTWGDIDDYFAWAPLAPEDLRDNRQHDYYWNLVEKKDFTNRNLSSRLAGENVLRKEAGRINANNQPVRSGFSTGPDTKEVAAHANQHITTRAIKEVNEPVSSVVNRTLFSGNHENELPVYKPEVKKTDFSNTNQIHNVAENRTNILHNTNEWPSVNHEAQKHTIENLPMKNTGVNRTIHENNGIHQTSGERRR